MKLSVYQPLLSSGDFADVYLEESSGLALRWEEGRLDNVSITEESGAGLRFFNGQETRYGHLDLSGPVSAPSSDGAARMGRLGTDLGRGLPSLKPAPAGSGAVCSHAVRVPPSEAALETKINFLRQAYRAAQNGPYVRQVTINYGERVKRVGYLNSLGESFIEKRTYVVFSLTVTVERDGDMQTAYDSLGGIGGLELFEGGAIEKLAAAVGRRAHEKLEAPQAPAGEMAVVIAASAGGTLIHEAVGHSLEADAVMEGTSPAYRGKIGTVVANSKLTVYDDPTVPGARGSFHYDDEGTRAEATKLIDGGILRDFLWDRLSARRANRASNGHGRRESYAHRPIPRMSNTFIAPGPDNPDDILRSVPTGLLVTKMGGGQVNPATGDFVFEVEEGFRLEDGRRTMVRGCTLLGNGPETLKMIDMVGTDHGWGIGTCGKEGQGVPVSDAVPTLRIPRLVIGGAGGGSK
jgi:TldD protein